MEGLDLPAEHGAVRIQYDLGRSGVEQGTYLMFAQSIMGCYDGASGDRHRECLDVLSVSSACNLVEAVAFTYGCDENHPGIQSRRLPNHSLRVHTKRNWYNNEDNANTACCQYCWFSIIAIMIELVSLSGQRESRRLGGGSGRSRS